MIPESLHHHVRRMTGRDPHESHRAATPLELFFDLTFVLAFGRGAAEFAHAIAAGHLGSGLIGFAFASFAICWAWINFSWFASAYDTDDWLFRITTMVQMVGVIILCLGVPTMFASLESSAYIDNSIIVFGYIVMRLAMVAQWLRAAKHDPSRRRTCLAYAIAISVAQIGWVFVMLLHLTTSVTLVLAGILALVEMAGPVIAERQGGTPWHAHHIVERYSLFAIIALGEGLVGTIAIVSAAVTKHGWSSEPVVICIAGIGLTFGMWWIYFVLPTAQILSVHRNRAFVWGYSQMILIAAIVAVGAGLDVSAYALTGETKVSTLMATAVIAVPLAVFLICIFSTYYYLGRRFDSFHTWLLAAVAFTISGSLFLAANGASLSLCLVTLTLAPIVVVVGYERRGHKHNELVIAKEGHDGGEH